MIDTFDSYCRPLEIPGVLHLIVCHYHLRPGGIRRVIELAVPHLVRRLNEAVQVTLATGEAPSPDWLQSFRDRLEPTPVRLLVEPSWNYTSEQRHRLEKIDRRIQTTLTRLFAGMNADNCLVWAHNLSIARNLLFARRLTKICGERQVPLIAHHHDWWFDNRWLRWPEIRRSGFRTLSSAAKVLFPAAANQQHVVINQADQRVLQRHLRRRVAWLPNLMEHFEAPAPARLSRCSQWLAKKLGADNSTIWTMPCRLLRRKNIAEALLLTRWLRPEACLVTTGPVSSADEHAYAQTLQRFARRHRWRLHLSILDTRDSNKPGVAELLARSEAILLTSLQEGFGLPYLEAAATGKPLVARALPNIAPDLAKFGFRFPQSYRELLVDARLLDWPAERQRQRDLFHAWRARLPQRCRRWVRTPEMLLQTPRAIPFSRLTLSGQLEVLTQPLGHSWELCAALNPSLVEWKERAAAGELQISPWPSEAERWLSGPAYARRFGEIARLAARNGAVQINAAAVQEDFIRHKLKAEHLFPLLWATQT